LSVSSLVWHASHSVGHFWPVWAFLFLMGLAVSALFGFFEKKRDDVVRMVDGLRQWDR
jgi:hypothetical protein